jgi:hypothetical protein
MRDRKNHLKQRYEKKIILRFKEYSNRCIYNLVLGSENDYYFLLYLRFKWFCGHAFITMSFIF